MARKQRVGSGAGSGATGGGAVGVKDFLEDFLSVPGARATLPVSSALEPFKRDFVTDARSHFNNFHFQLGGDHTLYYLLNLPEFMQTAMSMPNSEYRPIERAHNQAVADMLVNTESEGPLPFTDYVIHPRFRHQGVMMVHRGKVIFEAFPGMAETDVHFWASAAKTTVGLLAALLVLEGKIEPNLPITRYVPELGRCAWDQISVLNVMNHTTGLQTEEGLETILNPNSEIVAFFSAAFGVPNPGSGESESVVEVLRRFAPIEGEGPGDTVRYSAVNTHVMTLMIESVEGQPWASVFEERVWGHLGARMPAMFSLDPDGVAMPFGLMSSTLEDMARYGMLFTPSASMVSEKAIVSDEVLQLIYKSGNRRAFDGSSKDLRGRILFGEPAVALSYQFDWVFEDGALAKNGSLNQFLYLDPQRDFVGVAFSTTPYVEGYGETKLPEVFRTAAKILDGETY
ncbi:serine hydrolase domain-containing protein [Marimonas sp. MJW-29]|uniref:Serine hydrolase domain-containing protein n=1 Tax=Sulfitobacter sediminis TaxID=3234186 RepID=A0ABV3RV80_9RHOB